MYTKSTKKISPDSEKRRRLRLYALITVIVLLIAVVTTLIPRGSALQQCLRVLIGQNRDSCLYNLATLTKNASVCDHISTFSPSACYAKIAESTANASLCLRALHMNLTIGSNCVVYIANLTTNPNLCLDVNGRFSSDCFTGLAIRTGNTGLCQQIQNSTIEVVCSSSVSMNYASSSLNSSYCTGVSNTTNKSIIVSIIKLDSSVFGSSDLLSEISDLASSPSQSYTARDLCYTLMASRTGNSTYCGNVSAQIGALCSEAATSAVRYNTTQAANYSQLNYSQLLADCNQSPQYQSMCTQYVLLAEAIKTKNASICSSFATSMASWQCYTSMAVTYNDLSYCGYISNSTINSACVMSVKGG